MSLEDPLNLTSVTRIDPTPMQDRLKVEESQNQTSIEVALKKRIERRKVLDSIGGRAKLVGLNSLGTNWKDISTMFNERVESYTKDPLNFVPSVSEGDVTSSDQLKAYGIDVDSILYDEAFIANPDGSSADRSKAYRLFWEWGLAFGSPAVNPIGVPFQFNSLDDVRNPYGSGDMLEPFGQKSNDRIGRVYGDNIKRNHKVVQFQMGVDVNNVKLEDYLKDSNIANNYSYLRGETGLIGSLSNALASVGQMLGDVGRIFFGGSDKMVDFRERMDVYFDYVNELMFEMAVSMGLTRGDIKNDISGDNKKAAPWNSFDYIGGHPLVNNRLDIRQFLGQNKTEGFAGGGFGLTDMIGSVIGEAAATRVRYIPFLISKNVQISESWTNASEEHPLMTQVNEAAQEAFVSENGGSTNPLSDPGGALKSFLASKAKKAVFSRMGEIAAVQSGVGKLSLPEIWSSSRFERSYSLTFKFYSPYGDKLSIFENVYVPVICLLAMTAPKKLGKQSYTSPFIIRAYSPGLFACNFGMVSSLTLTKGEDKNEKTIDGLPKVVTASLQIKDLVPDFMISMNKGSFFHSSNTQLLDWMWIMSGQSLSEKDSIFRNTNLFLERVKKAYANFTSTDAWLNTLTSLPYIRGTLNFTQRFFEYNNQFEASHQLRYNSNIPTDSRVSDQ